MKQIHDLLKNDWIEEFAGPWGIQIMLAPKPCRTHISYIDDFIWRICVSYHDWKKVTKPFEYPIPRCDDASTLILVVSNTIYIITVDAKQGHHQITVYVSHQ